MLMISPSRQITMATVKPILPCSDRATARGICREANSDLSESLSDNQETNPSQPIMTVTVKPTSPSLEMELGISREANSDLLALHLATRQINLFRLITMEMEKLTLQSSDHRMAFGICFNQLPDLRVLRLVSELICLFRQITMATEKRTWRCLETARGISREVSQVLPALPLARLQTNLLRMLLCLNVGNRAKPFDLKASLYQLHNRR